MDLDDFVLGNYNFDDGYIIDPKILKSFNNIRANCYGQLPETFFDQRNKDWILERKKLRKKFNGIKGRRKNIFSMGRENDDFMLQINNGISRYDELKSLILYEWFNPRNEDVLDPFAGGVTRGAVASICGAKYTGIDIRIEQIEANYQEYNSDLIDWICGDSKNIDYILKGREFGHIQTSPPFPFVEHYSKLDGDLSNMRPDLKKFKSAYKDIFKKCYSLLKKGSLCVVDIGDGRDKDGYYHLFPEWQAIMMEDIGFKCINKIASITQPYGNRSLVAMKRFLETIDNPKKKLFNTLCMVYIYQKV